MGKELQTNISGEMLWDYAIRRRSLACDIGGLMVFESGNAWHESMKEALLKTPLQGAAPSAGARSETPIRHSGISLQSNVKQERR